MEIIQAVESYEVSRVYFREDNASTQFKLIQ